MKKFFPITIGTNKYGLEFVHNEFKDYEDYLIFVENLLKNDIPFITGIAKGFLPSPGYAQDKNISGHAVIIYKNEGDIFYILDPDGGIQRNKQNNFKEAEKLIKNNDTVNYDDFYDFIIKLIKPFALDLKNALKTIKNPSEIEKLLIEKLQEYQIFTLDFQKKLKYNGDLKATEFLLDYQKEPK